MSKNEYEAANGGNGAPWILLSLNVDLNGERETMATVRTPEGDRTLSLSEVEGKINLFEQLPEQNKRQFAQALYQMFREWALEQHREPGATDNDEQ